MEDFLETPEVNPVENLTEQNEYNIEKEDDEKRIRNKEYYCIEVVNVPSFISAMNKFMLLHPEFFKTNINKKIVYLSNNSVYSVYTEPLYFRDRIHQVNGYITAEINDEDIIMKLFINKTNKNKECYVKQLENYINHQTKYGNNVELYYYKVLSSSMIKHCYYNEPVEQWQKDITTLQNEFFSNHKEYLFSIINNKMKYNGIGNTSSSWNNLMLWGPMGSGKSSFVYRIAMMMKLSILSVDLSLYFNKKKELYSMFHGQEFSLPSLDTRETAINNSIIVLEEFDNAIDKLLDIENIFKYKDVIKREYLNMKNNEIKSRTTELINNYITNSEAEKKEVKTLREKLNEAKNDENMTYDKFMETVMLEDGFDMQNNMIFEKARMNVLKKRDFDNEVCGINAELNNIIKSMDEDNKSNILRLSDLLELFQSPIPVKNRIIIATTNNFQRIKKAMPALFRAGRMTPIHFDNLNWDSLNELCMYYFQRAITTEPRCINIPTSQIIELAIKHVLTKKTFEEFEKELLSLL